MLLGCLKGVDKRRYGTFLVVANSGDGDIAQISTVDGSQCH